MVFYVPGILVFILSLRIQYSTSAVLNPYAFTRENDWITMVDGVRLSVTLTIPVAKDGDEKCPVLVEYKPYRKYDNSDQASISYLVRRGFIVREDG